MGILKRFKDIMSSNINAMLDKAEDPEKMADQYLRNLEEDFSKVQSETASVMAEEKRARRAVDENKAEIAQMEEYAKKAVLSGNDEDAKAFLSKKSELEAKQIELEEALETASANATKMREMHDKLKDDITKVKERKETIKSKIAVAKTQERLNKIGDSFANAEGSLSAFDRMEEKANRMLDQANAKAELNKPTDESVESLKDKYETKDEASIEDELAKLKESLGK